MKKPPRITAGRGGMFCVSCARLLPHDPNYGLSINCYVCGRTHAASGLARIEDDGKRSILDVPLCEACLDDPRKDERLLSKYLKTPVFKVGEDGKVTTEQMEQIIALADKQDTTEH
jgi:hypothetical protein